MNELLKLIKALGESKTDEERADIMKKIETESARVDSALNTKQGEELTALLAALKPAPQAPQAQQTPQAPQANPEIDFLKGELEKLRKDRDDANKAAEDARKTKERSDTVGRLSSGLEKAFGKFTADLLAAKLYDSGSVTVSDNGDLKYLSGGLTYAGKDVFDRLMTDYKEHIQPARGNERIETKIAGDGKKIEDMNANELLVQHYTEKGFINK